MASRDNGERQRGSENSKRRQGYERDGVYYTPSANQQPRKRLQAGTGGASQTARRPVKESAAEREKPKKRASKGQYITFYIVTLVAAVVVCLSTFFFVFSHMVNNRPPSEGADNPASSASQAQPPEQPSISAIDEISITGVITDLSHARRTLEILDLESQIGLNFTADNGTNMQNRYGEVMSFAQFRPGDIVDARYTEVGGVLSSMSLATTAWERRNVSNVRVNPDNRTLAIGNDIFRYDERTISIFNDMPFNIEEINPLNVVTMRGMGSNVWFVEVSRGTGLINLVNGENIRDGVIEVDNNLTLQLNERGATDEPIRVQSGNRRILIRGSNIVDFLVHLDVNAGESAILDLSDIQVVAGVVTLNISEPDAIVTLNGTPRRAGEPLILDYGNYTLIVRRDGFVTYESTFELNEPTLDLVIMLEPEIRMRNITIESYPSGAQVYVDNSFVGYSPITTSAEEGIRMITLRREGFIEITFGTDERNRYHVTLREIQVDPFAGTGFGTPPPGITPGVPPVMP